MNLPELERRPLKDFKVVTRWHDLPKPSQRQSQPTNDTNVEFLLIERAMVWTKNTQPFRDLKTNK